MTFIELVKDWILATPRIRRVMIERSRALARTDAEKATLAKLWAAYQEDMRNAREVRLTEGQDTTQQDYVLQISTDDLYVSPLLHGRFQVMGSVVPKGTFYLADHQMADCVHREKMGGKDGDIRRFYTQKDAEDWAARVAGGAPAAEQTRTERVFGRRKETTTMAKPAKKEAAASTKEKAPRGPSASSRFKELIMANATAKKPLTDDEIFAKVAAEFGLDESKRTYVAWYRNDMRKKGTAGVPDPVGGEKPKASGAEKVAKMQAAKAAKAAANKAPPAPPAKPTAAEKKAMKATSAAVETARDAARGRKAGRSAAA